MNFKIPSIQCLTTHLYVITFGMKTSDNTLINPKMIQGNVVDLNDNLKMCLNKTRITHYFMINMFYSSTGRPFEVAAILVE